jgi:hypothetical protein
MITASVAEEIEGHNFAKTSFNHWTVWTSECCTQEGISSKEYFKVYTKHERGGEGRGYLIVTDDLDRCLAVMAIFIGFQIRERQCGERKIPRRGDANALHEEWQRDDTRQEERCVSQWC